jgi:ABC-type cobalamin/Fe3+-siderophores transport system ATPase subunit
VILLDEPFSSFDIGNQHLFYGILRDLAEQGKCIIMVSHDVFLSGKYLDTAVFLKNGTVFRSSAPGELLTESFLSQIYF